MLVGPRSGQNQQQQNQQQQRKDSTDKRWKETEQTTSDDFRLRIGLCACVFVAYFTILFLLYLNICIEFFCRRYTTLFSGSRRNEICPYNIHLMVLCAYFLELMGIHFQSYSLEIRHIWKISNSKFKIRLSSDLMKRKWYRYRAPYFDQGWKNLYPLSSLINISG